MSFPRDLYKTKLCILYQRGRCLRQSCSFAHGDAELRRHAGGGAGFNGRRDFRGGDLRERLQHRHSPRSKRFSPGRETRGRQGHSDRGRSHSRSPLRGRSSRSLSPLKSDSHKREKKRVRVDEPDRNFSDVSGDPADQANWVDENQEKHPKSPSKSPSPDPRNLLEEQLQEAYTEIDSLNERSIQVESLLEQKATNIKEQCAKISELDLKLHKEHEEYKRCSSKIKKFVKLLQRNERAQEEARKTQARLLKLTEDCSLADANKFLSHGEDSDVNIVSDGEAEPGTCRKAETQVYQMINSAAKDDSDMEGNNVENIGEVRQKTRSHGKQKPSKLSRSDPQENSLGFMQIKAHEGEQLNGISGRLLSEKIDKVVSSHSLDQANKARRWDMNSNLPSTGLAAHAEDDFVENDDTKHDSGGANPERLSMDTFSRRLSINGSREALTERLQMPAVVSNQYSQYEGDDEEVDVELVDDNLDDSNGFNHINRHDDLYVRGKALFPIS